MFIRIRNEAKEVNRLFLEKLGVSTKRDNGDTIGQFGSGSKFAPIAALRRGWRWVNVGEDSNGQYQMEYKAEDKDGLQVINFDYGDFVKESSFTVDAGVLSWEDPFQIFREAFSNALDSHLEFDANYWVDLVEEIDHEEGMFSVFLTASPELLEIYENIDLYFSLNAADQVHVERGRILVPEDDKLRIYFKSVLVHTVDESGFEDVGPPLFNYDLPHVVLNEERRVRDTYQIGTHIIDLWSTIPDTVDGRKTVTKILNRVNGSHADWSLLRSRIPSYIGWKLMWSEIWEEIYGDRAIPIPEELKKLAHLLRARGWNPILIKDNKFIIELLNSVGIPTPIQVLGDEAEFDFVELDILQQDQFDEALALVRSEGTAIPEAMGWKFFQPTEFQKSLLGMNKTALCEIYLNVSIFSDTAKLVGTMIHELDHQNTKLDDMQPEFRHIADERIGKLVVENARLKRMLQS